MTTHIRSKITKFMELHVDVGTEMLDSYDISNIVDFYH